MIPNLYPGIFIAFEGVDGCGKTSQLQLTKTWLMASGCHSICETKEPGKDRTFGKIIYEDLFNQNGFHKREPFFFQSWYAIDSRINNIQTVIPCLKVGFVVLSDRYRSSMVYGSFQDGDIRKLMAMNQLLLGENFIWPDAILIFDVSIKTAVKRSAMKGRKLDGHEGGATLTRVRKNYLYFAGLYPNCHVINAERPPEEVFEDVKKLITTILISKNRPH